MDAGQRHVGRAEHHHPAGRLATRPGGARPLTASAQTEIIEEHALKGTDGQTYAELDRDDPLGDTATNASFLQASLFTSILAFGVAAMTIGMGVLFVLIGLGIRDVEHQVEELAPAGSPATPMAAAPSS